MTSQLVIQFECDSVETFDDLIALEELLIVKLAETANTVVDGHDSGLGEFNIFIHTDEPESIFEEVGEMIREARPELTFAAGYRSFDQGEYVPVWPRGLKEFRVA